MKKRIREGALLLLVYFSGYALHMNGVGLQGEINKFSTAQCGQHKCFRLTAESAFTSAIDSGYSLTSANLEISDIVDRDTPILITSPDVFFDPKAQKIFLRNVANNKNHDILYDLKEERLYDFKR